MKNTFMKNILCAATFVASILTLTACALPHSEQVSGTARPTLQISGAAPNALLYVDGVSMGEVGLYDGRNHILKIEEGVHSISIVSNGKVLHEEKIYAAGGENKMIEVGGGAQ